MMTLLTNFASHVASHLFFLKTNLDGDTLSHIKHVSTANDNICSIDYRPWDQLPDELMEIILQNQTDIIDRISTSMVCTSWASIFKQRKNEFQIPLLRSPWLLLPNNDRPLWCSRKLSFYDMSHDRLYHFKVPIQGARCCGSCKGWLVMLTKDVAPIKSRFFLFNPISRATHKLPSLESVVDHISELSQVSDFVSKIQLSCEDPTNNCMVASYIESNPCTLAFCRVGSHNWSIYNDFVENHELSQVLFSNDTKFLYTLKYVDEGEPLSVTTYCFKSIGYQLTLKIIPVSIHTPIINEDWYEERLDEHTVIGRGLSTHHLVEYNDGNILLIRRVMDAFLSKDHAVIDDEEEDEEPILAYFYLKEFQIYMLHADQGTSNLTKLTSLDSQILFFSSSGLSLVQAKDFPELQGNCIYFVDDHLNTGERCLNFSSVCRESVIYHIQDGRIDRCFPSIPLPKRSHMGWFNPNLF